jgi:hypothetical protein
MIDLKEYCLEKFSWVIIVAVNLVTSLIIAIIIGGTIWVLHWFFRLIGMESSSIYLVISQLAEIEAFCFIVIFTAMSIHALWKAYNPKKEHVS